MIAEVINLFFNYFYHIVYNGICKMLKILTCRLIVRHLLTVGEN